MLYGFKTCRVLACSCLGDGQTEQEVIGPVTAWFPGCKITGASGEDKASQSN